MRPQYGKGNIFGSKQSLTSIVIGNPSWFLHTNQKFDCCELNAYTNTISSPSLDFFTMSAAVWFT